jgi:hypothetical protein
MLRFVVVALQPGADDLPDLDQTLEQVGAEHLGVIDLIEALNIAFWSACQVGGSAARCRALGDVPPVSVAV